MAKYRKKTLIDAEQWDGGAHPDVNTVGGVPNVYDALSDSFGNIAPGDWIVTGPRGEKYPVLADVFAEMYELVEGSPSAASATE